MEAVAANLADADAIAGVVARHKERFGRLDVLVNSAGVGIGAAATDHQVKHVDLQLGVNVRAIILLLPRSDRDAPGRRAPSMATRSS